jgi:hypothetical protein
VVTHFHERCSNLMRELLHALAATPDQTDGVDFSEPRVP